MAKPEWGTKRICLQCNTRFYDLRRSPIHCPKCSAEFDPDAVIRKRRGRPPAHEVKPVPSPEILPQDIEINLAEEVELEDAEDTIIEDTSDFGDEDEDVVGVEHKPDEE